MPRNRHLLAAIIGVLIAVSAGGGALGQKSGGTLRVYSADSPPGLSIYEQATPWGQGPLMSVYNNLILFDQHIAQNSLETIVPDLASRWEWNEDGTGLTFTLRLARQVIRFKKLSYYVCAVRNAPETLETGGVSSIRYRE
jgi:ABC-type transport system substrate-binding protein